MPYSAKPNVQLLTEILLQYGIEHIVISPGSRNGALTMHFMEHPKFQCYSIVDERSAGFFALGLAKQQQKPVVVCCTSGSAIVNYYPAVVEAFYQNIPLIVISADRPTNLIDKFDGQTIRQFEVFEKHVKYSTQINDIPFPIFKKDKILKLQMAVWKSIEESTPAHINIPISEPIYASCDKHKPPFVEPHYSRKFKQQIDFKNLTEKWNNSTKKMVLVGMQDKDSELERTLSFLSNDDSIIVLTESTSNLNNEKFIHHIDQVIFGLSESEKSNLKPDLLLTIGQNVVSKKIKQFLRKFTPKEHWHLNKYWQPDTFFALTEKLKIGSSEFFKEFIPHYKPISSDYKKLWITLKNKSKNRHKEFISNLEFCDFKVYELLFQKIPKNTVIHFGNSSPIRYSQLFKIKNKVYCNRGTSGIDGSTSTAIGYALKSKNPNLLITGDIGFFYDSNALWNNYIPKNFKIILINNGGGNIFKIIPGPDKTNALETFFETKHNLSAKHLCNMHDLQYFYADAQLSLEKKLNHFFNENSEPGLLEINTIKYDNASILRNYFDFLFIN